MPTNTGWVSSISCANAVTCWAGGAGTTLSLAGTGNSGSTWQVDTGGTTNQESNVSCASTEVCIATTNNELLTTDDNGERDAGHTADHYYDGRDHYDDRPDYHDNRGDDDYDRADYDDDQGDHHHDRGDHYDDQALLHDTTAPTTTRLHRQQLQPRRQQRRQRQLRRRRPQCRLRRLSSTARW